MGLRSRKGGAAGEAAQVRKMDREGQMLADADAPLQRMQVHTEAFNILWRDFLVKLTSALIAYSLLATYQHSADQDHAALDVLSGLYYAVAAMWLRSLKDTEYTLGTFLRDKFFCAALALLLSQLLFMAFHHNEREEGLHHEFFPTAVVHMPLTLGLLFYMRANVTQIAGNRAALASMSEQIEKHRERRD